MQLASIQFMFYFFPAILIVYYALGFSRLMQNLALLLASLLLYAAGTPGSAMLLIASIVFNWLLGRKLFQSAAKTPGFRRGLLALIIIVNLALLFCGRYAGAITHAFNNWFGLGLPESHMGVFPMGVAIFTLMALSYIIDIYRGEVEPLKNPVTLGLYIAFFPLQMAGPVICYRDINRQLTERKASFTLFAKGCQRFVIGLAKNVLLAVPLSDIADRIFDLSNLGVNATVPVVLALLGIVAFALYIYYFFSGYADMAIGLGNMFGFTIKENFNYPYAAVNLTDFWRRWNMCGVFWFRKYFFSPLRKTRLQGKEAQEETNYKLSRDMLLVWVLFGLWHGPSLTFCIWGLIHGFFLLAENVTSLDQRRQSSIVSNIYMLVVVMIAWVFFRADTVMDALNYLKNLFYLNHNDFYGDLAFIFFQENYIYLIFGLLFTQPVFKIVKQSLEQNGTALGKLAVKCLTPPALIALYGVCILYLIQGSAYGS